MKTRHIALATLIAILLQPLLVLLTCVLLFRDGLPPFEVTVFYSCIVMGAASLPILLFGIPCFDVLHKTQKLNFTSLSCCGVVLAMIPYLLIAHPRQMAAYTGTSQWFGYTLPAYENGQPMAGAWLDYAAFALGFGMHGFVASSVFYLFWRKYKLQAVPS